LVGKATVVRPATPGDVDLLVAWHADPEVARYWDDETFTREQIELRLRRPDVDSYVVMRDEAPVGYIQAWFDRQSPGAGGIDMFLIPSARDRGFGPDAARTLARWLTTSGVLSRVTVDPYAWNGRAISAWKKAGFEPEEEREADDEHVDRWLLMRFVEAVDEHDLS